MLAADNWGGRPVSYYLGSVDSPLCSPLSPAEDLFSEGVASSPRSPQVESAQKSAQLLWAARLPYWHGWLYRHDLTKTCQNVGVHWNVGGRRHFDPFSQEKSKS